MFLNNFDQCRFAKAMCQELDLEFPNNIIELQTLLRKLSDLIRETGSSLSKMMYGVKTPQCGSHSNLILKMVLKVVKF